MGNRDLLQVSEIFGPTIQGEGAAAGRHCLFIRTFQCNLECSWCDTAHTWAVTPVKAAKTVSGKMYDLAEELHRMSYDEVLDRVKKLWPVDTKPTMIVWSGGEPMMQQPQIEPIAAVLSAWGNQNHFETAGTIKPTEMMQRYATQFNVSPKLEHSGNRLGKRYKPDVLKAFVDTGKAWFKFVVKETQDFEEIDYIVLSCGIPPHNVQIMPEGNTIDGNIDGARKMIDQGLRRGYGLSFRSHVLLWPKIDRGV